MSWWQLILLCIVIAIVCRFLGVRIGTAYAKRQKKRDEVMRNGSKHV